VGRLEHHRHWATVLIYVVIAFYAWRSVREARTLRREQLRPFVVAEFIPGFLITFRVKNYGQTMARNVRLWWDPFPVTTFTDDNRRRTRSCSPRASRSYRLARRYPHFSNTCRTV
jgi:hypothetical protein